MSSCVNNHRETIECSAGMDDESASKPEKENEDRNDDHEDEDEEDEEEEDVDFNPFLKKTRSPEASSSLSSEVEGVDCYLSKITGEEVQNYAVGDANHGEEVVVRTVVSDAPKKRKRKPDSGILWQNQSATGSSKPPRVNVDGDDDDDDNDAICKRTRARYSLAGFTLDELETFLQETDDEDDLQNVDDEEEYRKFLAAVLQGGDADGESTRENGNVDDEDEDNDADFEIELEELLESEVDETARDGDQRMENERCGRRPQTRQNRRHKASAQYKKKLLEQTNRPLRPLVPILPNGVVASFTTRGANYGCFLSSEEGGLINGFTAEQIGQLHSLIHEHVQLLIQIFSICVLDASRQHIASQVQSLIFEMLHKRDEIIARKSEPYPSACFHPAYMSPSGACKLPIQQRVESKSPSDMQPSESQNAPSKGRSENGDGQLSSLQSTGSFWVPSVSGSIVSVLDVTPLKLVGRFLDDVSNAVREYRQNQINSNVDAWNERKPLFHLPCSLSFDEGNVCVAANVVSSTPAQDTPKKTLAASIVESAKRQSITLVPKDINKLAERFIPFFNPELFPHKPPPAAVANRILFTDSEDELLALGMMEYNTDWKAIKQRFLPCKSEHQIFVRQKNRCSSKAPENPIKAVRRMKTSPLTAEEIESIQEGLRAHKLDWMSMWRVCVPHRDPSLLPRQLRIALGTQRSYKLDDAKKEKRRIYELKRRRSKTSDSEKWQLICEKADGMCGQNNSADDPVYHVSRWRADTSHIVSSNQGGKEHPRDTLSEENINNGEPNDCGTGKSQPRTENKHSVSSTSLYNQHLSAASHATRVMPCSSNTMQPNYKVSDVRMNTRKSQIHLPPYRTRRTDGACLVKLAPDLPPVNLPRSVRVIPVSDFKSRQLVEHTASASRSETGNAGKEFAAPVLPHIAVVRTNKVNRNNQVTDGAIHSQKEDSANVNDTGIVEERGSDSDLQLHPLLFQAPEDGQHPYYHPLTSGTGTSSSLSFFSGNQLQLHLSLLHNPQQANHVIDRYKKSSKTKETISSSCGIDFHPLLQKTQEETGGLHHAACSTTSRFVYSGSKSSQFQNHLDPVQVKSPVGATCSPGSKRHPNEGANDLDLEIHLSSTSTKEKNCESSDGTNTQPWLAVSAQKSDVPFNNFNRSNMDDAIDRTHPEIVMEQEELSDSEEESEEHVEFECEEMTDSDGEEGAGCDQVTVVHDKEGPDFVMEEVPADADYGDVQCEQSRAAREEENTTIPRSSSRSLKLSLTSIENDGSSSSWLSLDSCAPAQNPSSVAKHNEDAIIRGPAAKSLAPCRPNRSCKKTTPSTKRIATQKDVIDMAQQLSLGPSAASTSRKSRKSGNKTDTSFSTEMT